MEKNRLSMFRMKTLMKTRFKVMTKCPFWMTVVTKRRTNRKMLYSQWLGDAHDSLNPELIIKCFKKTGTCLDMNGKENDKVHIDQIQTFKVPKKGDPKMKPLTAEEIEAWEKREISHRTAKVMETFD